MKGETRNRAARIILKWLEEGEFPDRLLAGETKDRGFLMEVTYGSVKWKRQLEWLMERLVSREPEPVVLAHLLAALYQVFHMDTVEPYALVDETVEAVKTARGKAGAGFVNAILRRALREKAALLKDLAAAPLAVRESHPDVLVDRWTRLFGPERTAAILAWNNARPGVTVRVQGSRAAFADVTAKWAAEGVSFEPHTACPDRCLALGKGIDVTKLPGWAEGWVTVQDPSTLPAVDLLKAERGMRILDACCAPGGKLSDIVDRVGGDGVVALDASRARLDLVKENLARLGGESVTVMAGDLARPETGRKLLEGGSYDRILLDAPCTNTGVLRRRADARWRFEPDSAREMALVQGRLLSSAAALLKHGGRLVYSTCSIEPEEDGELVRVWLEKHHGWKKIDETVWLPGEHDADGSYAVALGNGVG
jgi:16S rRNA (cytosine967-C5)-methyltransferase